MSYRGAIETVKKGKSRAYGEVSEEDSSDIGHTGTTVDESGRKLSHAKEIQCNSCFLTTCRLEIRAKS